MQLDIFEHSRDVVLRNDVLDALQRRDAVAARCAWQRFAQEVPDDRSLPALGTLIDAVERCTTAPFTGHDAACEARLRLEGEVTSAAVASFGEAGAPAWLAPLWRDAAERAARLDFRADRAEDHCAPLRLRAGDWAAAADAAATIDSWRRIPAPLAWMAEARFRLESLDAVWPLLVELAWLAPARFDALTKRLADPVLDKLRKRFDAQFEGDGTVSDLAWFPAWLLTEKPALARCFGLAQPSRDSPPEQAMQLLLQLLHLERQGRHHDLVERRKALRDLHPFLYGAYLKTR